ncbi:MAG TPA: molybdate ABC transporter substrate-binding protein [Candidatus Methanoperedens sp.]|nr:molybdate ABC transporter substrate-binding protein [Candidatus Methanoperedens sp.]
MGTLVGVLAATTLALLMPCSAAAEEAVVVSAAASLKGAFAQIGAMLAAGGGAPTVFNFGASGELLAQIRGGAPADVFASAAAREMDALEKEGLLLPGTRTNFAANEIVVLVPAAAGSAVSTFADLAKPAVVRIAVGNPATSPAGRYAAEVLAQVGIAEAVKAKLVPGETVRQIIDWVARGEVDAGIAYATDAAGRAQDVRIAAAAPAGSHGPIVYPIALLGGTARAAAARAFVDAVRSDAGRAILARHGFLPAPAGP